MAGISSQNIALSYDILNGSEFVPLTNLLEIPDLGDETESLEVTTLADGAHVFIDGLKNYGDNVPFKFLYEKTQFDALVELGSTVCKWKVTLPDGGNYTFSGTCSVKLNGVGVNDVVTYTLAVRPNTEMTWA